MSQKFGKRFGSAGYFTPTYPIFKERFKLFTTPIDPTLLGHPSIDSHMILKDCFNTPS